MIHTPMLTITIESMTSDDTTVITMNGASSASVIAYTVHRATEFMTEYTVTYARDGVDYKREHYEPLVLTEVNADELALMFA